MKIRVLNSFAVAGKHKEAGTLLELDDDLARDLIFRKRAEYVDEPTNRAHGLTTSTAAPLKKRGRPKK